MLQVRPTPHSVPDNIWHTLLITLAASVGLWLGWDHLQTALEQGKSLSAMEVHLRSGEAGGIYGGIEALTDPLVALRWNRAVSTLGWLLTLFMVGRILTRLGGFLSALPALIVLTNLPGLMRFMVSAGSGSLGAFFFLLAFSAMLLEEHQATWIRAGLYGALAAVLHPVWLLPAAGLLVACAEFNRTAALRSGLAFAGLLSVLGLPMALALPGGWGWPVRALADAGSGFPHVFNGSFFFLLGSFVLLLVCGFRRRGFGWWALVASLPMAGLGAWLAGDGFAGLVPVLLLVSLGLVKLPRLLDVRHPRAYQSVLLCQLLLWLPLHLDRRDVTPDPVETPGRLEPAVNESEMGIAWDTDTE